MLLVGKITHFRDLKGPLMMITTTIFAAGNQWSALEDTLWCFWYGAPQARRGREVFPA